jgi:hypothetical protein
MALTRKGYDPAGLEFDGIYDGSEMGATLTAWNKAGSLQAALFEAIASVWLRKGSTLLTRLHGRKAFRD